ncbi:MAG: hypothetical protein D6798_03595 [Deltaproteobacteria bacterium]|nr:MAG: hypothetical protein D6798_03595 [Deltaproteobacteria bacterium]
MRPPSTAALLLATACTTANGPSGSDSGPGLDTADGTAAPCGPDVPTGLQVGDCAPDFTLPDANGAPFTLSDQRGKVALVDISAVW